MKEMDVPPLVEEEIEIDEPVKHISSDETNYIIITETGRLLNVVKSVSIQPFIEDPDRFLTYLWVEAKEGFYLLSQRFECGAGQGWTLMKQFIPVEELTFFLEYRDELRDTLESW